MRFHALPRTLDDLERGDFRLEIRALRVLVAVAHPESVAIARLRNEGSVAYRAERQRESQVLSSGQWI